MDIAEKLEKVSVVHFHRASNLCALRKHDDHTYWGYIGFPEGHVLFGRRFVKTGRVALYKVEVPSTGNTQIDRRWWVGFEGGYSYEKTLEMLRQASDFIGDSRKLQELVENSLG